MHGGLCSLPVATVGCVVTSDEEHVVVGGHGRVLSELAFPVHQNLHDAGAKVPSGRVQGQVGGGAVTRLKVLTWRRRVEGGREERAEKEERGR